MNPHWNGKVMEALKLIGHGCMWNRHWTEFVYVPIEDAFHFFLIAHAPLFDKGVCLLINGNGSYFDESHASEDLISPLKKSEQMKERLTNLTKQTVSFDVQTYEELCDSLELEVKRQRLEITRWKEIADRLLDIVLCTSCRKDKDEVYMGEDYELARAWKPKCDSCKFRFDTVFNTTGYLD